MNADVIPSITRRLIAKKIATKYLWLAGQIVKQHATSAEQVSPGDLYGGVRVCGRNLCVRKSLLTRMRRYVHPNECILGVVLKMFRQIRIGCALVDVE